MSSSTMSSSTTSSSTTSSSTTSSSTTSSSTTSLAREPKWALPQVRVIRYLTERILYEGEATLRTMEWFLSALWPEGLSQGLYQLLDVESPSLIDEATSGLATCDAERKAMIHEEFVDRVQDTGCITPVILKGLLIALSTSAGGPAARCALDARWTLRQAHDIIHLSNQIQLEKDVTQETMGWFVRAIWPNSSSQAITWPLRYSVHSTLPVNSVHECLFSPAIRDKFVRLVLTTTEITDNILDWLYQALSRTVREGSPWVNGQDPFSNNKDKLDTSEEETSGDDSTLRAESNLSCGSSTADFDNENMLPLQRAASLEISNLGSATLDDKSLDYTGGSAIEERSQFQEAVGYLLQLSRDNMPAAANRFINASHRLADDSRLRDSPAPLAKMDQRGSGENSTESQDMPAKRHQIEGNNRPRKRVKRSGDLVFSISAVSIGGRGDEDEALNKDSESGVEYDIVPILAAFPE